MKITRAIITAASPRQRSLPLQILVDRDGSPKPVLRILLDEVGQAGIEESCLVVHPGDEAAYREAAGDSAAQLQFLPQAEPLGYAHAIYSARDFAGGEPFLHMVGDHLYVSTSKSCAQQIVEVARAHSCSVSGVQRTRESLLPYFGAVGGQRVKGTHDLYRIDGVQEKPTPTAAEQSLLVPGLRAGQYLCFFGMHVFTPTAMELLARRIEGASDARKVQFSDVLDELAGQEQYLALEARGRRYPIDVRYGLFFSQLALALSGQDREEVLTSISDLLVQRELEQDER